jgi:hypothetical protein
MCQVDVGEWDDVMPQRLSIPLYSAAAALRVPATSDMARWSSSMASTASVLVAAACLVSSGVSATDNVPLHSLALVAC